MSGFDSYNFSTSPTAKVNEPDRSGRDVSWHRFLRATSVAAAAPGAPPSINYAGMVANAASIKTLSELIQAGIPVLYRSHIYHAISKHHDPLPEPYNTYSEAPLSPSINAEITKDLDRTFPTHKDNHSDTLAEILHAYANLHPDIGYCQGLGLLTFPLTVLSTTASSSLQILHRFTHIFGPNFFDHTCLGRYGDMLAFNHLVRAVHPTLFAALENQGVDVGLATADWFATGFAGKFRDMEFCFRIWDIVLYEGHVAFLWRVGLAVLNAVADSLVAVCSSLSDSVNVFNMLRETTMQWGDVDALINAAAGIVMPDAKVWQTRERKKRAFDEECERVRRRYWGKVEKAREEEEEEVEEDSPPEEGLPSEE